MYERNNKRVKRYNTSRKVVTIKTKMTEENKKEMIELAKEILI